MNLQIPVLTTLSDRSVWIIDDDIPIQAADFEKDDMVNGDRPIDRGTLLSLLMKEDDWKDQTVLELCKELATKAGELNGFIEPTSAIAHLKKGAKAPDVIIFDMDYRNIEKNRTIEYLDIILKGYLSAIQIYTRESIETIAPDLASFAGKYSNRLQPPQLKSITAEKLEEIISKKLAGSLSANLATNIRRLSTIAIENVLVKIDDLPLPVAVRLLAGDDEENLDENLNAVELIELLSAKVSDYLKSSNELTTAIKGFAQKAKVPPEKEKLFIDETVEIFATTVRNRIQYDGWLYDAIKSAIHSTESFVVDASTKKIIQDFFAFRVYDQPGDGLVRTGDIIKLGDAGEDNYPDLYLILTPACDLAHFWLKTRGILTLVKMHPLTAGRGIDRIKLYGNKYGKNSSITAKHPFILPSVFVDGFDPMDYALFFHEIDSRKLDVATLVVGMTDPQKKNQYSSQLTYPLLSQLGEKIKRECRISEPFLSAILSEISSRMFRNGVPDFPTEEKNRLAGNI